MKPLVAVAWFLPLITWLAAAFIKVCTNTFAAIQQAFFWIWAMMYALLVGLFASLGFPTSSWPGADYFYGLWADFSPYFYYANAWVPLYEGLGYLTVYVGVWSAFIPIKIVIRHLPAVGN